MDNKSIARLASVFCIFLGLVLILKKKEKDTSYTLTIEASTGGTTSPPVGSYLILEGKMQTVVAVANTGWYFSAWSGDASGGNASINIIMDRNKTIKANFTTSPPPPPPTVTVTCKAANYGSAAKYWVVLTKSIGSALAVPIESDITLSDIPPDDMNGNKTGFVIVDMYTADPVYGNGESLAGRDGYPNLGVGYGLSRDLFNGETITWIAYPEGWWKDQSGNWI